MWLLASMSVVRIVNVMNMLASMSVVARWYEWGC